MKILIIMAGFFPGKKYGGPPVSVDNFCSLMKNHNCKIVTLDHDLGDILRYKEISDGWNNRANCSVRYLPDNQYNADEFKKIILEEKPDVLYLQGLFQSCILPCLKIAKKNKIKVLLAPRGELCRGAFNIKKYKKIPYIHIIRGLGLVDGVHFQSTSDEETKAIKKLLRVEDDNIHKLDNIPSIPRKEFIHQYKKAGEAKLVFLSRIHPKKNLSAAIDYLFDLKGDVIFDIYGPIEDKEYWIKCQKEIERLPQNINVTYKGLVDHDLVHDIFSNYNAFLFPTYSENYGHVIAESLMVGTPVIISDQTPWTDVNTSNAGKAISLESRQSFVDAIQEVVDMDNTHFEDCSRKAVSFVSKKTRIDKLRETYNEVINKM